MLGPSRGFAFPEEGSRVWRHSFRISAGETTADRFRGVMVNDNDFFLAPLSRRLKVPFERIQEFPQESSHCLMWFKDALEAWRPNVAPLLEPAQVGRLFHFLSMPLPGSLPPKSSNFPLHSSACAGLPPHSGSYCGAIEVQCKVHTERDGNRRQQGQAVRLRRSRGRCKRQLELIKKKKKCSVRKLRFCPGCWHFDQDSLLLKYQLLHL